jgi:hypothetical protein
MGATSNSRKAVSVMIRKKRNGADRAAPFVGETRPSVYGLPRKSSLPMFTPVERRMS